MRVTLEIISGPHTGRKLVVASGYVVQVGRTEWADFVLPDDAEMSSLHFAVAYQGGVCQLRDLNSSNGTLVNGNRVSNVALADGDRIQAGRTTFTVHLEGAAASCPTVSNDPAASFRAALDDPDPAVRSEVLMAALWTRQPWLLEHCHGRAAQPSLDHWDAIYLLAVLGKPRDLSRILALGRAAELGPARFEILGAFGHPAVVDLLLTAMNGDDPDSAAAAAVAFKKITGIEVEADQARTHWDQIKPRLAAATRCCCGYDLSRLATEDVLSQLDMQSRWEVTCRGHFEGVWSKSLAALEAMPLS